MLQTIRLKNFAIIDQLELELGAGFNVLTGETGAGKSLILSALSLLLGARARPELVQEGAKEAVVEGLFQPRDAVDAERVDAALEARGLPVEEGQLLIRRVLPREGRGRIYLNGALATLRLLQELVAPEVELCGQHEHTRLLSPLAQAEYLDAHARARFPEFQRVFAGWESNYAAFQEAQRVLEGLQAAQASGPEAEDFLRFQLKEIETLNPDPEEPTVLEAERDRLRHAKSLREAAVLAEELLYSGESSAVSTLGRALSALGAVASFDPRLAAILPGLESALAEAEENGRDLLDYRCGMEDDPERMETIEARLSELSRMARKHGGSVAGLVALRDKLRDQLTRCSDHEQRVAEAERAVVKACSVAREDAAALSGLRRRAARDLGQALGRLLPSLGMPGVRILIELIPLDGLCARGADRIEIRMVEGREGRGHLLAKIASGGELSRLLLALRAVRVEGGGVPSLVFDEVDTGVGGAVAQSVGFRLASLGERHQVLCVTHLPQVAASATHHLHLRRVRGKRGGVSVAGVEGEARVEAIAELLGGSSVTQSARIHAKELLTSTQRAAHSVGSKRAPKRRTRAKPARSAAPKAA